MAPSVKSLPCTPEDQGSDSRHSQESQVCVVCVCTQHSEEGAGGSLEFTGQHPCQMGAQTATVYQQTKQRGRVKKILHTNLWSSHLSGTHMYARVPPRWLSGYRHLLCLPHDLNSFPAAHITEKDRCPLQELYMFLAAQPSPQPPPRFI